MRSGQVIGGIVAGSILGMTVGYMMRPKNKPMSMLKGYEDDEIIGISSDVFGKPIS